MIRQHILQQQRLGYNHERLLERYERLLAPSVSQFSTFGASVLPGRNYEQHLGMLSNHQDPARKSLAAISRAGVGASNETYLWNGSMDQSEALPRNINSIMQHSRQQRVPLVHAEKFEPVQVYEHPVFGRTPAYIRPVPHEQKDLERVSDDDDKDENQSADDTDDETLLQSSIGMPVNRTRVQDVEKRSNAIDADDSDDGSVESAPRGYISYKKWKTKYEHLIPVNPLLYSIYTRRPNGSIHSYGRAMYSSPDRQRQLSGDNELTSATPSDDGSDASTMHGDAFSSSKQRYNRLNSRLPSTRLAPRSLAPIGKDWSDPSLLALFRTHIVSFIESDEESSDEEDAPVSSSAPFLFANRSDPMLATSSVPTASFPATRMSALLDAASVNNPGMIFERSLLIRYVR